jgi:predicted RecA/RadA family phage recombinase
MLNETHDPDNLRVICSYPTTPASGGVVVYGDLCGVAEGDEGTDGYTVVRFGAWIGDQSVVSSGAIAVGDRLYASKATPVILSNNPSGVFFGYANEVIASGTATIEVLKPPFGGKNAGVDLSLIVVSTKGSDLVGDGSWNNPYLTITKALTMVSTTRKTIIIMPGEYTEATVLTWPNVNGLLIKGLDEDGNVVISNADAADEVILINPTFTSATFEAFLENVCISHDAQKGIEIDNENMTRKLLVHLTGVSTEQVSTGDSINVTHTTAGQAIRIYAKRCDEIEGLVDVVVANADDRFRFMEGCVLIGGLTTAGAVAGEVSLLHSVVLTSGLTIGSATQVVTTFASCYRTDAGVYSQLADGYSG